MTTNLFNPQEVNLQIQPLPTYIDSDGSFKINTPMLSTYNFDGLIPKKQEAISVTLVKPGYLVQIVSGGDYYPVVSIEKDDLDLENTGFVTINYINSLGNTASEDYLISDTIEAIYEDWNEKILGSQGWGITAAGNAIFTNVAVRGRIEADEGYISGNLTIGSGGANIVSNLITAGDVNTNVTSISGGVITSGRIKNSTYDGPPSGGNAFSTTGAQLNVDDGTIVTPSFRVDSGGNAYFKGDITAKSGYFGNPSYGMSIVDDGSTVTIRSTTLRMGSQLSSGTLHGSINFYTTAGGSIGSISSAASNKTWLSLGDGIILGTALDYLFIPSASNSIRSQYRGSGFNWYDTNNNILMSISGGAGALQVYRDINANSGYAYKVNGTAFINSSRALTVDGITNQSNGITNNGGQIYSLPSANNPINATANLNIDSATGLIKRINSTQRVKHSIVALSETSFGESVLKNKIVDGLPNINYLNVLNITPVEFKTIEDGIETNRTLLGFIAEDIADKVPEIATYDENGNPEYYDINGIVSGLLAIVQNQQKEINQLQDRLRIIEERLEL